MAHGWRWLRRNFARGGRRCVELIEADLPPMTRSGPVSERCGPGYREVGMEPTPRHSSSTLRHASTKLRAPHSTLKHSISTLRASRITVRHSRAAVCPSRPALRASNFRPPRAAFQPRTVDRHGWRLALHSLALAHDSRRSKISSENCGVPQSECRACASDCGRRVSEGRTPPSNPGARLCIGGGPLWRHHRLQCVLQLIERVRLA